MIILSDLSEVLIRGVYGIHEYIQKRYGAEVSGFYLERCKKTKGSFYELMRGHYTETQFWDIFLDNRQWPFGVDDIKKMVSRNFAKTIPGTLEVYQNIIAYPDTTRPFAKIVHGRPEIWIVSDHIIERRAELEMLHPEVFQLASRLFWSYDFGITKCDVGFFERLMHDTGLLPEEVIFIDDALENLIGANDAGITSIGFTDAKNLESDLKDYGFDIRPRRNT